jgi:hypothetical protein
MQGRDATKRGGGWSSSRAPVQCACCGQQWPRDPSLEVPCPACHARVGAWCRRPSGHKAMALHVDRERQALAMGKVHRCPAGALSQAGAPRSLDEVRTRALAALGATPARSQMH